MCLLNKNFNASNYYTEVSFYIVAHADDWQLFMHPNVYSDIINPYNKNVFIITTAGDAGNDEKYWKGREEGAISSLRFCLAPHKSFTESGGIKEINNHKVYYKQIRNSIFYFLRLPDGNLDGSGFLSACFQSLSKLKTGEINSITAIDDSTTYLSWQDFYTTLEVIILAESEQIARQKINYINPDATINLNDHADHLATGTAIQCINSITTMWQLMYSGYSLKNTTDATNTDFFWKVGMFAAYEKAVFDNCGYSTLKENINNYITWCLSSVQPIIIKPVNPQ